MPERTVNVASRVRAALAALGATVVGTTSFTAAPAAHAAIDSFCAGLGAVWDGGACTAVVKSQREAEMLLTLRVPAELIDNPTAGPVLRDYYTRLFNGWRATGNTTPRDSSARADYEIIPGPGGLQSVVVHETFEPFGIQANNAYRSFLFDMNSGRRLYLPDLFRPGVNANQAVSAAAAPILPPVLDAAAPRTHRAPTRSPWRSSSPTATAPGTRATTALSRSPVIPCASTCRTSRCPAKAQVHETVSVGPWTVAPSWPTSRWLRWRVS